ncbi:hypothetical protein ACFY8B_14175 [Streptomyces sp. NPDC012751]|uniref:hypothetical protein n=1 Tax=Streptomyces sp. NPDC012751 TaxID=3364846 RepID=UPI0036A5D479
MTAHEEARSGRRAPESSPYRHPAAGWGAAKGVAQFLVPIAWDDAFAMVGRVLRSLDDPDQAG